ncbi:hypothetical protein JTB14_025401 [Gonioctena quinquepunctata]|nr:hypothetical protein JTB14_025401 [Gonioctena quinquepunctata]
MDPVIITRQKYKLLKEAGRDTSQNTSQSLRDDVSDGGTISVVSVAKSGKKSDATASESVARRLKLEAQMKPDEIMARILAAEEKMQMRTLRYKKMIKTRLKLKNTRIDEEAKVRLLNG